MQTERAHNRTYPAHICPDCGAEHGRRPAEETTTWRRGTCDWCNRVRAVTDARAYRDLKEPRR